LEELPELVNSYRQALHCIDNYKNKLDLSSIEFFYPTTLAILSPFIESVKPKDIIFSNNDVLQYFNTIMNSSINISKTFVPFIKLPKISKDYDMESHKIFDAIREWSENIYEPLEFVIDELVGNVHQHANHTNAYILAQYYPMRRFVEVAIIDDGIGIPKSLRDAYNFDNLNDSELIIKAIEGYSSKREEGRAFGLGSSLHIVVEVLNGEALISSIKGMVYLNNNKGMLVSDTIGYIKGTLVGIRIPVHDDINSINVPEEADKRISLNKYSVIYV
jgi:hypothetical protein